MSAIAFILGIALIAALWYQAHPTIIDRGEGRPRPIWDDHSWGHLGGAFLVATLFCVLGATPLGAFALSMVLWLAVELAQKYPRDKLGGHVDPWDVVWDVVGAGGAALLCFIFGAASHA